MAANAIRADNYKVVSDSSGRVNEMVVNLFKNNKYKNLIYMPNIKIIEELPFLTLNTKKKL